MTDRKTGTSLRLTTGYSEYLGWLTHNIRVLSDIQVAAIRGVNPAAVRQRFRRLAQNGLVSLSQQLIQTPCDLGEPLYEWKPDSPSVEPNWDAIAWKTECRWNTHATRVLVASATRLAMKQTGGYIGGRPERQLETQHDLALSQLFLGMLTQDHNISKRWISEDALTGFAAGDKRPDAVIRTGDHEVFIELAGKAYSARKLKAISAAFARRGVHHRIY